MPPTLYIFAWYALPFFAYVGVRRCNERALHIRAIIATTVGGWVLLMVFVAAADASDRARMATFDLNRDGEISGAKRTKEAENAIQDQGRDTGRAVAPILGFPLTAVWYSFLFGALYGGAWAFRKLFVRSHNPDNPLADPER